jgi:hypothetical protein
MGRRCGSLGLELPIGFSSLQGHILIPKLLRRTLSLDSLWKLTVLVSPLAERYQNTISYTFMELKAVFYEIKDTCLSHSIKTDRRSTWDKGALILEELHLKMFEYLRKICFERKELVSKLRWELLIKPDQ